MGLDMYLIKKVFLFEKDNKIKKEIHKLLKLTDKEKIESVSIKVGYWRKANAIHNWFVENIQEGNDDCKEYWVSLEQLRELKKVCEEVLRLWNEDKEENIGKIDELLPTGNGSFFGNTEYNDWYIDDVKQTIKIIENIEKMEMVNELRKDKQFLTDYYYSSSW